VPTACKLQLTTSNHVGYPENAHVGEDTHRVGGPPVCETKHGHGCPGDAHDGGCPRVSRAAHVSGAPACETQHGHEDRRLL